MKLASGHLALFGVLEVNFLHRLMPFLFSSIPETSRQSEAMLDRPNALGQFGGRKLEVRILSIFVQCLRETFHGISSRISAKIYGATPILYRNSH